MPSRIDAAADWLMSDDSAYEQNREAALRAAKEMLDAADLADEESFGPRLSAARDRAIAVMNEAPGANREAFIAALSAETKIPIDSKLGDCGDRILADLFLRGYVVKRDALS